MSIFSGKCDLYDHISFEKMYDKGSYKLSDELECFEIFKKKTGGVIYQNRKIVVSEWNQQRVKEKSKGEFDYTEVTTEVEDKRVKGGKKQITSYTYTYWGRTYNTLKELNKHGVFITEEIYFDTILDIIPYYPYIVSASACDKEHEHIIIDNEPWYMVEYNRMLKNGCCPSYPSFYIKRLSEHYLEVINTYYNYRLEERTKRIPVVGYKPLHNGYYEIVLDKPVDYMHSVKFVWKNGIITPHWCGPQVKEDEPNVILISEQDIDKFLINDIKSGNIEIEYVESCEFPNEARDEK